MKAAVNGVLNVSVLDGWWCEGYDKEAGWAVGRGEEYPDPEYQDSVDSEALYNVLENEVVPSFYDRSEGDIPARWTKMMRESIRMALGYFTSHRMVAEYNNYYTEAAAAFSELLAHDGRKARKLVEQRHRFQTLWGEISVGPPVCDRDISSLHVGDRFRITSRVFLGKLKPDDVDVEVCYGPVNSENLITRSSAELMSLREDRADGSCIYEHDIECRATGRYGFTTRVTPHGSEWKNLLPGFLTWADGVR
jgi:starch phosphorylase